MPPIPANTLAQQTASSVLLAVLAMLVGIALICAVGFAWRRRDLLPLYLIVGGLLAFLMEPIVDILGACWHPAIGQWTAYTFLERPMPVWLGFAYTWYFGAQTALCWYLLDRGKLRGQQLWLLWAAMVISDVILETVALHFDVWIYYGQQPLVFFKFPLWWAAPNSTAVILAAVLAYKLGPWLTGPWRLTTVLLPIACYGMTSVSIGMPAFLAINIPDVPMVMTQLAGVACLLLDALFIAALVRLLTISPDPVRPPAGLPA